MNLWVFKSMWWNTDFRNSLTQQYLCKEMPKILMPELFFFWTAELSLCDRSFFFLMYAFPLNALYLDFATKVGRVHTPTIDSLHCWGRGEASAVTWVKLNGRFFPEARWIFYNFSNFYPQRKLIKPVDPIRKVHKMIISKYRLNVKSKE